MTIDGDALEIDADMGIEEIEELKNFVSSRLKYIEKINVLGAKEVGSASLFEFLFGVKKSKPSVEIPLIDRGFCEFEHFGKIYWN